MFGAPWPFCPFILGIRTSWPSAAVGSLGAAAPPPASPSSPGLGIFWFSNSCDGLVVFCCVPCRKVRNGRAWPGRGEGSWL
ncbi:hypothetical protein CKAH01_06499 [Colletotrichum kahawae]|uniref:Uncharacterized protein n=1 Tax=Colletotrichum kahawae TaxID=34407 RepID=A0AAD9Y848_COLKA|nr:hypothetical protein CKAH01_06499 [Colletotrichum kahawae]